MDGVSRTLEAYQRNIDPSELSVAPYSSSTLGGAVSYGIPITETDTINLGFRYDHTKLDALRHEPALLLPVRRGVRLDDRQHRRQHGVGA